MEIALLKEDIISQLWSAYTKTQEYKSGLTKAIQANHRLVIDQETEGLRLIYRHFVASLLMSRSMKGELQARKPATWLREWKQMHKALFEHILRNCGNFRKKEVRFGNPGDEELHKIPSQQLVPHELNHLAETIQGFLSRDYPDDLEKFTTLAKIHYQFIRIHPFPDGNGRIARALTDQIAIYFGFPVAMGGFPRHDPKRRQAYHKAIRACIEDPDCTLLAMWIKSYIDIQLQTIA